MLAQVSHDLKTPINGITCLLESAKRDKGIAKKTLELIDVSL
jgi:hypothetical protein